MSQYAGLTKLQAVNEVLAAITEQPATSLDTGGTSIQARAEDKLDKIDREVQEMGWHCNTDTIVLSPSLDPIVLYRMDTTAGATETNEILPGTYDGTLVDTPTLEATSALGKPGDTAITFDGAADYMTSAPPAVNYTTNGISMDCFIKTSETASKQTIIHLFNGDDYITLTLEANGDLTLTINDDTNTTNLVASVVGSSDIRDGTYHHVAAVYDPSADVVLLYIDGSRQQVFMNGTAAKPSTALDDGSDLMALSLATFGVGASDFFNGTLDEVAIYTNVLSEGEVWRHAKIGIEVGVDRIFISGDILDIDSAGISINVDVLIDDMMLWNSTDQTYSFSADLTCEVVRRRTFISLPSSLKTAITQKAALQFQTDILGSAKVDAFLRESARKAMRTAKSKSGLRKDINVLDSTSARLRPTRRRVRHYLGET